MAEHVMPEELAEEAQHLHRRRQELEAQVAELNPLALNAVVALLDAWSRFSDEHAHLIYGLIGLRIDEVDLAERLGSGWQVTDRGLAFSPLWWSDNA